MWYFATSMSAPSAAPAPPPARTIGYSTPVWVVVVIVVAAGVGGLGFYGGYGYRGSPASTPAATVNTTLSVLGAGTLTYTFPELASALANETPGITAPAAAQTYEGSLDITTAITTLAAKADVAAVADFRLIPQVLKPTYASYEIVFAQTQEVLIYNASLPAFNGITSSNWGEKLIAATAPGGNDRLGVWNASTDPNGYNEIFSMILQGMFSNGSTSAIYGHFYSGAPGSYADPNPSTTILEHESQAATLIRTGTVSAVITYKAVAVQNDLPYVLLDPIVGLGANNSTALADYAKLSTQIFSSSGSLTAVYPAPILFAVTVPSNAPNAALGALFVHLLLSPQGSAILEQGGAWTPVFPGWADTPSAVPGILAPDVTSLPSWATPFLT
jgi:molybdate/tungstate transport system substrate-binding protein